MSMGKTRRNYPRCWEFDDAELMSAEEHVYHAARCYGKRVYPTRAKAVKAKRNNVRRYGLRYRVYRCPY